MAAYVAFLPSAETGECELMRRLMNSCVKLAQEEN